MKVKETCWNVQSKRQEAILDAFITTLGIIDFTQCSENTRYVMCNICIVRRDRLLSEKCKTEVKSIDSKSLIYNRLSFESSSRLYFNRSSHFGRIHGEQKKYNTFSIIRTGRDRVSKKFPVNPTFGIIEYLNYQNSG